jgi:hypothetical protein
MGALHGPLRDRLLPKLRNRKPPLSARRRNELRHSKLQLSKQPHNEQQPSKLQPNGLRLRDRLQIASLAMLEAHSSAPAIKTLGSLVPATEIPACWQMMARHCVPPMQESFRIRVVACGAQRRSFAARCFMPTVAAGGKMQIGNGDTGSAQGAVGITIFAFALIIRSI